MSLEGRWQSRDMLQSRKVRGGGVVRAREASRRREMGSGILLRLVVCFLSIFLVDGGRKTWVNTSELQRPVANAKLRSYPGRLP